MSEELNIENLEKAVKQMGMRCPSRMQRDPKYLKLSNFAIELGFIAQSAEEFIKQELDAIRERCTEGFRER